MADQTTIQPEKPKRNLGKIIGIIITAIVIVVGLWLLATYFLLGNDAESNKNNSRDIDTNSSYTEY